jgi:hypothetical protein
LETVTVVQVNRRLQGLDEKRIKEKDSRYEEKKKKKRVPMK